MRCWFFHKWAKWVIVKDSIAKGLDVQQRTCSRCGLVEQRCL